MQRHPWDIGFASAVLQDVPDGCSSAPDAWGEGCTLQVVLFQDAFVCRHVNKANHWVEGFAQPYDAESRYFLACIDEGRIPDGLSELISLRPRDGGVLVEVRDYRGSSQELCPVSSAFLSCEPPVDPTEYSFKTHPGVSTCRLWRNLLQPPAKSTNSSSSSSSNSHSSSSMLGLDPSADNMMLPFDESIAMSQDQLEALAMDAMPLFLEAGVMSPRLTEVEPFPPAPFFPATPMASPASVPASQPRRPLARVRPHQATKSQRQVQTPTWQAAAARAARVAQFIASDSENELGDCGATGEKLSALRITAPRGDLDVEDAFSDSSPIDRPFASVHDQRQIAARLGVGPQQSPLPGTFQFIEKLKGKKRRRISVPAELSYGSPSWKNRGHMDHFVRAAASFERQHAVSLQINMRRIMLIDSVASDDPQLSPGGMLFLADELHDWRMPTEVIAAHTASGKQDDEKLTREFARSAMINPAADPVFSVDLSGSDSPSSLMEAMVL